MFCQKCGAQMDDDALFCPKCGQKLIHREGIFGAQIISSAFADGKCKKCGTNIPGVWKLP